MTQENKAIQAVSGENTSRTILAYQDNTFDLVDLLIKLIKRKHILLWSLFLFIAAGLVYVVVKAPVYSYVTAIEIGSQLTKNGTPVFFENAQTVKSKLVTAYIPQVLQEVAKASPDDISIKDIKINVSIPKQSKLIVLSAKGTQNQSSVLPDIEQKILDHLVKDHARILNVIRSSIVKEWAEEEAELAYLKNDKVFDVARKELQAKLVTAQTDYQRIKEPDLVRVKRKTLENKLKTAQNKLGLLIDLGKKLNKDAGNLQKAEQRLTRQVEIIRHEIQQSHAKRDQAVKDVSDPTQAMTLLMIDSEIQQTRQFLTNLERRLYIEVADKLSEIKVSIKDNQRRQDAMLAEISKIKLEIQNFDKELELEGAPAHAEIDRIQAELAGIQVERERKIQQQIQKIKDLTIQIENLTPTRSVTPPMQSLNPQGLGRIKTLVIFVCIGLVVGFMLIVIVEMGERARIRMRELDLNS